MRVAFVEDILNFSIPLGIYRGVSKMSRSASAKQAGAQP